MAGRDLAVVQLDLADLAHVLVDAVDPVPDAGRRAYGRRARRHERQRAQARVVRRKKERHEGALFHAGDTNIYEKSIIKD